MFFVVCIHLPSENDHPFSYTHYKIVCFLSDMQPTQDAYNSRPDTHAKTLQFNMTTSTSEFTPTSSWYADAITYWQDIPASVEGMLGGHPELHQRDISASSSFLSRLTSHSVGTLRACDCGSGIGRVTKHLLLKQFQYVDMVEPIGTFLEKARQVEFLGHEIKTGRIERLIHSSLQDFQPEQARYDVVWCQWVLAYLTDDDLVQFLKRCVQGLRPGGMIIAKENVDKKGYTVDEVDSSVTRSHDVFCRLFTQAGLDVAWEQRQTGFPAGFFAVRMYALKPKQS